MQYLSIPIIGYASYRVYQHVSTNISTYKEIYQNASWKTLTEFCVYQVRVKASHYLETGSLSSSQSNHSLIYYDGPTKYSIVFPKKRGPCPFSYVTSIRTWDYAEDNVTEESDVTDIIRMYAGPSHNFHGVPTTPNMLGYHHLLFRFRNGAAESFSYDQVIIYPSSAPKTG